MTRLLRWLLPGLYWRIWYDGANWGWEQGRLAEYVAKQRPGRQVPPSPPPSRDHLLSHGRQAVDREVLAQETEYAASGGAYANLLGSLRSLGLIDYPARGLVTLQSVLFVGG